MKADQGFAWVSAFRTHTGPVRKVNEDACLEAPDIGLWAVADGMGGHEAGQTASGMIVESLSALRETTPCPDLTAAAGATLTAVNTALRKISESQFEGRTIGSTVAVFIANGNTATCLWAGDSRVYRLRGGLLEQITQDHSHVQDLVRNGVLSAEEARNHRLSNIITRAVGADTELELDCEELQIEKEDVYLLCSDGLNKVIEDAEIAQVLEQGTCEEIVNALIHLCLVRNVSDNVTVGVVRPVPKSSVGELH
jgi:serine/threonine protein phosphatase PrpC